jgi:predicted nucleic acid-binding protein
VIVVSNTSPIVNLAAVGRLDLLQSLYKEVDVPEAVHREVAKVGLRLGAPIAVSPGWIHSRQVMNLTLAMALQADLDEGESEAITLALDLKAEILLLDERGGKASRCPFGHPGDRCTRDPATSQARRVPPGREAGSR